MPLSVSAPLEPTASPSHRQRRCRRRRSRRARALRTRSVSSFTDLRTRDAFTGASSTALTVIATASVSPSWWPPLRCRCCPGRRSSASACQAVGVQAAAIGQPVQRRVDVPDRSGSVIVGRRRRHPREADRRWSQRQHAAGTDSVTVAIAAAESTSDIDSAFAPLSTRSVSSFTDCAPEPRSPARRSPR